MKFIARLFKRTNVERDGESEKNEAKENIDYSLLNLVEGQSLQKAEVEGKVLTDELMISIMKFRAETESLNYIREEIESIMEDSDGEKIVMRGFAKTLKVK